MIKLQRFPTAFQMLYLLPVFIILPFLPDSPRWLSSHDRMEEAEESLSKVLGEEKASPHFQAQFEEIREVVRLEHAAEETKFSDLWNSEGRNLYRLLVGSSSQLLQQLGGINSKSAFQAQSAGHRYTSTNRG